MGLSERKNKQRIGNDPRNLAWRQDTTSFGQQYLLKAGHTPNTSLGLNPSSGLVNPIAVARKLDNSGIGVGRLRKEGGTEGGGIGSAGGGLEEVLRRLAAAESGEASGSGNAAASGSGSGGKKVLGGFAKAVVDDVVDTIVVREAVEAIPVAEGSTSVTAAVVKPNRMAHRAKFRASKALASSQNAAAIQEILGMPSPSSTPIPSGQTTPITSLSDSTEFVDQHDLISTNKTSVADYFKQRMEEKKKAMQEAMRLAAGGEAVAVPVGGVEAPEVGEEEIVIVGGSANREEAKVPEEQDETVAEVKSERKDKKDKKDKKEKKDKKSKRKRDADDEEDGKIEASTPAEVVDISTQGAVGQVPGAGDEDEKARKKREKKEKKALKGEKKRKVEA